MRLLLGAVLTSDFCLRPTVETITSIRWERLSVRYCGQTKISVVSPPVSHFSSVLGEVLVELTTVIKLEFLTIRDKGALGSLVNYLNIELVKLE